MAAKLGQEVGFSTIAAMARRFGITTPINTHPAMVLGTSDVRLIDMTSAFASVANKGVAVTPYGITRVTANGQTIYSHEVDRSRVLVAPYVAAEMIDLLQTAVNTGTGRAAQIGRPVAGKTGTTTSLKDGWFLGFSSGLTTGVWMGRDDAKPVAGLHGGTAPAKAWAAFMKPATANRPIEQFDTQVTLPDWQLEPDEEAYYGQPDDGSAGAPMVDPDGNPLPQAPRESDPQAQGEPADGGAPDTPPQQQLNDLIDRVTGRDAPSRDPAPRDGVRDGQRAPSATAPSRQGPPPRDGYLPPRAPLQRPVQDDRPTQ